MDEKVPGGNKIALAEGESEHDSDSDRGVGGEDDGAPSSTGKTTDRISRRAAGTQSLPRFSAGGGSKVSRKVDSLPVNILNDSYTAASTSMTATADRKNRAKKMIRSFGSFVQKVARQITSVTLYASSPVARFKGQTARADGTDATATVAGESVASGAGNPSSDSSHPSGVSAKAAAYDEKPPGVIGIQNHGNTCFMNAVLQCLSNTEPLLGYFVMDQYKDDIKRSNKRNAKRFGTKGELTEQLATLLRSLWTFKYTAEISSEFKATVAKYGCQYRGSTQHDAQEFLVWLLDKVHEDLNIATKKKYRANRSSYGRSDEDVAAEALANQARCNNSYIYDIFQALYRSSLTCPNCSHRSNTFDPFLSLSLPIPHNDSQPVYVVVVFSSSNDVAATTTRSASLKIGILMNQENSVKDLRRHVSNKTDVPNESMILIEIDCSGGNSSLNDNQSIRELNENASIYAIEIAADRDCRTSTSNIATTTTTSLTSSSSSSSGVESCSSSSSSDENLKIVVVNKMANGDEMKRSAAPPFPLSVSTKCSAVELKSQILRYVTSRNSSSSTTLTLDDFHVKLEGDSNQTFVEDSSPLDSNESIKRILSNFENGFGPKHVRMSAEWKTTDESNEFLSLNEKIEEDESVRQVKTLDQQSSLSTLDECFQVYTQEEKLGPDNAWLCPSCRKYQQGTMKALTLWSLPEVLVIHLKRFKQDAIHRTKLNTLIMFPLIGLDLRHHVQRKNDPSPFSSSSLLPPPPPLRSVKSSAWMSWKPGRKTTDATDDFLYDLYAVSNHYGDMHGGHYTAFCKNLANGRWYSYNDNKAVEMREEEVVTRAAYLLFYQKRNSHFPQKNREWLATCQLMEYNVPRTVTSHSLDNLLDADCDAKSNDASPDEEYLRNIPVYTTLHPPDRIARKASTRNNRMRVGDSSAAAGGENGGTAGEAEKVQLDFKAAAAADSIGNHSNEDEDSSVKRNVRLSNGDLSSKDETVASAAGTATSAGATASSGTGRSTSASTGTAASSGTCTFTSVVGTGTPAGTAISSGTGTFTSGTTALFATSAGTTNDSCGTSTTTTFAGTTTACSTTERKTSSAASHVGNDDVAKSKSELISQKRTEITSTFDDIRS